MSADTGLGKTHLGFAIAFSIALQKPFCHWGSGNADHVPAVLIIDGEMPQELVKERVQDCVDRHGCPASIDILCKEQIEDMSPLDTEAGQRWVDGYIYRFGPFDFIIFDNIMSLTIADLRDEEGWRLMMPWIKSLTARHIGQLWINHTGHDKSRDYGTSTRIWQFDTAMIAERFDDPSADITFKLSFRKARLRSPGTRDDYEPHVLRLADGSWTSTRAESRGPLNQKRAPQGFASAIEALTHTLAASGELSAVTPHGPTVRCVTLDQWRNEMKRRGLFDLDDKVHLTNSDRSFFRRCRHFGMDTGQIAISGQFVWIPS